MEIPAPPAPSNAEDRNALDLLQAALGGDFEFKQRLGRGSVATVYLAKERALGRLVAVKVLLPGRAKDETSRRRFEREAKAAASLSHPNVVQVFRFGRLPNETPYLVMRFVKGRTLEDRIAAQGPLPADLAREILHGVASALAAAHAQGIVHRDVRPANVLWDEERNQALLADFGIAALLATSGEDSTRLTKTGQMLGDPRYLSPEQLLDQDLTELADMYAFGILGYEIYTAQGPYEAKTNTQWITAHLSGKPRDLGQLRPDVDATIADLLRRCLNREPNHRPSAAAVASALQARSSGAFSASGSGSVEDVLTWSELSRRRIPQLIGAAFAAGASFVGFVAVFVELYEASRVWLDLSFPLAACGVAAATVVAWFHGERGRQQTNVLEWILLSVIGVIWVSVSARIVVGR
jgi:serine/threonine-protein kinase